MSTDESMTRGMSLHLAFAQYAGKYLHHFEHDQMSRDAHRLAELLPNADLGDPDSLDAERVATLYLALTNTLGQAPWSPEYVERTRALMPDLVAELIADERLRADSDAAMSSRPTRASLHFGGPDQPADGAWMILAQQAIDAVTDDPDLAADLVSLVSNTEQRTPWRARRSVDIEQEALAYYVNHGAILPVSRKNLETDATETLAMLRALMNEAAPCGANECEHPQALPIMRALQVYEAMAAFNNKPRWGFDFERNLVAALRAAGYDDAHQNLDPYGAWDVGCTDAQGPYQLQLKGPENEKTGVTVGGSIRFGVFARAQTLLESHLGRVMGEGTKARRMNGASQKAMRDVLVGMLLDHFDPRADGAYRHILYRTETAVGDHERHVNIFAVPMATIIDTLRAAAAGSLPEEAQLRVAPLKRANSSSWKVALDLNDDDRVEFNVSPRGDIQLMVSGPGLVRQLGDFGLLSSPEIEARLERYGAHKPVSDGLLTAEQREAAWSVPAMVEAVYDRTAEPTHSM